MFAEQDGQRKHRTAYVGLPRKNGKSTLGAALALYGLLADNEDGAEVYSCAGDRKQAQIVYDEAKRMVLAEPELAEVIKTYRWHMEGPRNSLYRALSADAALQQGLNPSFVIFDEVHVQPNRDLWDAMVLGQGARARPFIIGITTAGYNRSSLAWELYDHGRRVVAAEEVDPSFYFWWSEPADSFGDWRDETIWKEANPALDDFLYRSALIEDARHTPEAPFRRFHLNQWTVTEHAWLPYGSWDALAKPGYIPPMGTEIVLSFDGAWTGDSAALLGTTVEQVPHHFVVGSWERKPSEDHWEVPVDEVHRVVDASQLRWKIREMPCDPHEWRQQMQEWKARRLPVEEWPTSSTVRMSPACADFYKAVMDRRMTHDGDPRLTRHISNAVLKEDRFGARIVKRSSREHIDLAVTAVIGYNRATHYAGQPARQPRRLVTY